MSIVLVDVLGRLDGYFHAADGVDGDPFFSPGGCTGM
jgi:hypothetical protein